MPLHVIQLLTKEELETVQRTIASATFGDGAVTSGVIARQAKHNQELSPEGSEGGALINQILTRAFSRHAIYRAWALPRENTAFIVNRYEEGMYYDDHVDNGVHDFGGGRWVRSDLAITVFLSDPSTYDGGELVIDSDRESNMVKLRVGEAVVYPATSIHRVERVRRGVRIAAVCWVESLIRDGAQRALLFDLATVIETTLREEPTPQRQKTLTSLSKVRHNLLRMWVDR
ncbi:MAG: Fe2+-dependent dioxygenase [Deltaproteobacteria bacterium]|nr:Fe2+-dependent dioxygenase [Deltaproteobacteria bacterium]